MMDTPWTILYMALGFMTGFIGSDMYTLYVIEPRSRKRREALEKELEESSEKGRLQAIYDIEMIKKFYDKKKEDFYKERKDNE
jgi:hypothetical protein